MSKTYFFLVFLLAASFTGCLGGGDGTVFFDADEWADGVQIRVEKEGTQVVFNCVTSTSPKCNFGGNVFYILYDTDMNIIYGDEFPSDSESHIVNLPEEPVRVSIAGGNGAEIMFRTF